MEEKKKAFSKKIKIFLGILTMTTIILTIFFIVKNRKENISDDIPDGYIAVFNGGSGEVTYSTYIYKIDNGQDNYGFKYINTTNNTKSWGSTKWIVNVTKRGEVSWSDDVFKVAEENNAYSYVKLPNDDKIYTIDEFAEMFIMN